jgi:hypothetical protein
MGPTLSVGGPRGRAEDPCDPLRLERAPGVPVRLDGPISESITSDIMTEAIMGDIIEEDVVRSWC